MSVTEWLGYAKAVSDQWGLTPWVYRVSGADSGVCRLQQILQ